MFYCNKEIPEELASYHEGYDTDSSCDSVQVAEETTREDDEQTEEDYIDDFEEDEEVIDINLGITWSLCVCVCVCVRERVRGLEMADLLLMVY